MRELLALVSPDANTLAVADAIAKATIVLAAAAATSVVFRRASAAVRHMIWALAIVSALLLPALSIALPRWQMPIVTIQNATAAPAPAFAAPEVFTGARETGDKKSFSDLSYSPAPVKTPRVEASSGVETPRFQFAMPSWPAIGVFLWAAVAAVILGRLALGLIAVFLMSRRTPRVTDALWLPLARQVAGDLGISRPVAFLRSERAVMPMAWGLFKPTVLMPAEADRWPAARLRVVLLHELAHVKRRDCLMHAIAQIACAIYWFNPLAWVAARRLRAERELACDDLVIAAGTRGSEYATELLEIARVMRAGRFPAVLAGATLAMAHRSQLEGRLMAILDTTTPRTGAGRFRTAVATTFFAAALIPLASLQPWAYAAAPEPARGHHDAASDNAAPAPSTAQEPAPLAGVRGGIQGGVTGGVSGGVPGGVTGGVQGGLAGAVAVRINADGSGIAGSVVDSIADAVADAVTQSPAPTPSPNPNPNPNPSPAPQVKVWDERAPRKPADPKIVAALTAALKDSDKEVRQTALHALVQMRDPSIYEPLVAALSDSSPDVRAQAVQGLSQLRDRRAIPALAQALKDQSPTVREQAAHALGQMRDPATVPDLMTALKDQSASVREQVVHALGQLRDKRALDGLIMALKDQSASVREQAAHALGQIRDAAAVTALIAALKDESASVREQAAHALGQTRETRALDALTEALKDPNAGVRRQAAFAIGQIAR